MPETTDLLSILFDSAPAAPKQAPMPTEERHYWRCPDCLSVAVTVGKLSSLPWDNARQSRQLHCSLCSVQCEYMGKVNYRTRMLEQTEERCACNEKCQSATGPHCSCICGGANHGVAMYVTVVTSVSNVPEITPIDGKAQARRDEYRAALAAAKERIGWAYAAMARKRDYEYLPDSVYWPARQAIKDLMSAKNRAQHGPRLKALSKVGTTN